MKKQLLTILITAAISIALFSNSHVPLLPAPVPVAAQVSNPKDANITAIRAAVAKFNSAMDDALAARAEYVGRSFNFVTGDCVGSNSSTTFSCDDVDQAFTDFNTVISAVRAGGTLSAGVWPNVLKIK